MYNPGALNAANPGKASAAMIEQSIDQRAVGMSGRRMHDHAPGFVDHDDVRVLIYNVKRNILRRGG
jgi:hypothetical protein